MTYRQAAVAALACWLTACSPAPALNNSPDATDTVGPETDAPATATDTAATGADTSTDTSTDTATDTAADTTSTSGPACPDCDDDNVCTYDLCQPKAATCQHIPLPAATTCATDEDNCTGQWCDGAGHCVAYATGECG